ncbi:MAG: cupin domain-containing protein [Candidatus Dormibacteria bacterium]|jgi:mannose-6-phosphate isomerase-like protein (cupin superfamily)
MTRPIDLAAILSTIDSPWKPHTVAAVNDYDVRVVKTRGEFTEHAHPETDELFLVLSGSLVIRLGDEELTLGPGQLAVVPRGRRHQPISTQGAEVLLIEPRATVNTGDTPSQLTTEPVRLL